MRKALGRVKLGLLAATAVFGVAVAQPSTMSEHWPPAGVSYYGDLKSPDISGLWLGVAMGVPGHGVANNNGTTADGRPPVYLQPWPLPYTPAYQKIADDRAAATRAGHALGDISSRCLPFGLPLMLVSKNYPDEITQTPGEVTFWMYATFPVVIWTDGRGHPKDLRLSYNGHSIGYWVGDTLYVDTVGINGTTTLDGQRDPHGPDLHIKWSVQKVAPNILHTHTTLYDEDAFTQPVTLTNIWERKAERKWELLDDQSCFENNGAFKDTKVEPGFMKF